jgi:dienelactone hydrolase
MLRIKKFLAVVPASILVFFVTCSNTVIEESLNGHWEGEMKCNGRSLAIRFNISADKFLFDIPGLGFFGQPVNNWDVTGNDFIFKVSGKEEITVNGTIRTNELNATIDDVENVSIKMQRTSKEPLFFIEEELKYNSDGAKISGTLIKPNGPGPFPVIIFVHGSGKMTRETMRSGANMFVESGSAAFIFDRRGKGESEGDTSRILPIALMAGDVLNAVKFLKDRVEIDNEKIGLYGLSQGGWVVPYAASICDDIDFLITISAPGITPDEQDAYVIYSIVQKQINKVHEKNEWGKYYDQTDIHSKKNYKDNIDYGETEVVKGFSWFNPIPVWQKINIPVLAVWGADDDIVPPVESIENIKNALINNKECTFKIFEGANHTLRLLAEKDKFAGKWEIVAPGSNEFILDWFKSRVFLNKK